MLASDAVPDSALRAVEARLAQALAATAQEAHVSGRVAQHEGIRGYLSGYDGARTHESVAADAVAADDRGVRTHRGTIVHPGFLKRVPARHERAWIGDIREDTARTQEDVVADFYPRIE
jgi:hypothetical protein